MGIYVKYRLERFLDTCIDQEVEQGVCSLLESFFQTMDFRTISYRASVGLNADEAAVILSKQLVSLPVIMDGGSGLKFKIETKMKNEWHLFFMRDVFPRIELRALVGDATKIGQKQGKILVNNKAAHLFRDWSAIYGSTVDIYLSLKLSSFRQHVHIHAPGGNLSGGIQFRKICRDIWDRAHPQNVVPRRMSFWFSRRDRFLHSFDKLLIESIGTEELNTMLSKMGLKQTLWFPSLHE